jgi:hypothetical protein
MSGQTQPVITAYSLYLYFSSRNYRFASESLEPITKRHMFPYGNKYRSIPRLADRFKVNRHLIKEILL